MPGEPLNCSAVMAPGMRDREVVVVVVVEAGVGPWEWLWP